MSRVKVNIYPWYTTQKRPWWS